MSPKFPVRPVAKPTENQIDQASHPPRSRRLRAAFAAGTMLVASACTLQQHAGSQAGAAAGEAPSTALEGLTIAQAALARWSSVTTLPIVPVSAANLPDG